MNREAVNSIIAAFDGVAGLRDAVKRAGWPVKAGSIYKWRNEGRIPGIWGVRLIQAAETTGRKLDRQTLLLAMDSLPSKKECAA